MKGGFIANERTGSMQFVEDLFATSAQLFQRALEFEGYPPDTKFAVFSDDNPFVIFLDKVRTRAFEARSNYLNFGYEGLSITQSKATLYKRKKK